MQLVEPIQNLSLGNSLMTVDCASTWALFPGQSRFHEKACTSIKPDFWRHAMLKCQLDSCHSSRIWSYARTYPVVVVRYNPWFPCILWFLPSFAKDVCLISEFTSTKRSFAGSFGSLVTTMRCEAKFRHHWRGAGNPHESPNHVQPVELHNGTM